MTESARRSSSTDRDRWRYRTAAMRAL